MGGVKLGKNQTKTSTATGQQGAQGPDQATQDKINEIWKSAQGAAGSIPPAVQQALDALSGKSGAINQYMDPYQQQVIDANNAQWQRTNQQTLNAVDSRATGAGAFGGSRAAIAQGAALSGNNIAQQQQTAGLLSQGYNNALTQAGAAANLGMAAGSPELWQYQQLKNAFTGLPYGQTYSGTGYNRSTATNTGASAGLGRQ